MATAVTPTTPELAAQRRGWYGYAWASHTFEATVVTVFMSRYLPSVAENAVGKEGRLHVLGIPLNPGSLFAYTVAFGSALLFLVLPITGAIADRTGRKREMLLTFGFLGAASCTAMILIGRTDWQLGAVLFLAAFLSYSAGKVVANSILVDIAAPDQRDRVSSVGWAISYIGGGILLAFNVIASFLIEDRGTLARLSLCSAGIWWAIFMLLPLRLLRHLPRSPIATREIEGSVLTAGFRELGHTLRGMRQVPLTLLFLLAYLVYYDGITTVTTMASPYGQEELKLSETVLLGTILVIQFCAFGGALLMGRLSDRWGAKRVIAGGLLVWIGIVVTAYFLEAGNVAQFVTLGLVLSLVVGGTQALSRSLYSSMIPAGREAEYFSFYEFSASGTALLGPLIFGLTLQNTGSYRTAIISLVVFFVVGLALLLTVNVRKAMLAAGNTPPASLD